MATHSESKTMSVEVLEYKLTCLICGNTQFYRKGNGIAESNDNGPTPSGKNQCYVCSRCGYMHWFEN